MDVARWLRDLGFERYEPVFRDHEIDWEVLAELTEGDLEKLGLPLGPRKKLLKAIAGLSGKPMAVPPEAAPSLRPVAPEAERRQLTVMFVDLVGSTELARRLDPEDMGDIIRAYHRTCAAVVQRWEGHIAKYMGDGVLAYFGWPRAHEDAAERAVRAGLELTECLSAAIAGDSTPVAARVGIATGLVMVGELIGEEAARERAVVGETPNLAARLQALAEPNTVVIAPGTRQLVAGSFDLESLGPRYLKGFADPIPAWNVLGESSAVSRFEARQEGRPAALVGRNTELALLLESWQRAMDGAGQVVLLAGEPGIGKSRLVQALRERTSATPHARVHYQGSPYHVNSALYPLADQLERAAGFQRGDTTEAKLDKLEALLASTGVAAAAVAPLLAALLSLPADGRYPPLDLTPKQQKARTLAALVDQLASLASRQPVLLIVEDAHWLDPTSLEWLALVVDRVQHLPALTVITSRPEFTLPWLDRAHVTLLTVDRLDREQVTALIGRITGSRTLPAEISEQIVARTDGVPLFVEELTKAVLEGGLLRATGEHYELADPLPLAIPATLQDSLMARLDRLAPVKEVAQTAAAIGRQFSFDLLAAVAPLGDTGLSQALRELADAELIFRDEHEPYANYSFKHALVRDAAYQSLLRSKRQRLHARIARALEERFPDRAEAEPELLAHHCAEAGLTEEAIAWRERAGQRAARRFAPKEAIAHFNQALELLRRLPDTPERARSEVRLQMALGAWLMATRGPVPEMERAYARAREICGRLGDGRQLYTAVWGLWYFHAGRMELRTARDLAYQLLGLAERQRDRGLLLQGHHAAWTVLQFQGDLQRCWEHHEQGLALYDPEAHGSHAQIYGGHDPGVCCRSRGAMTLWLLGHPDRAEAMAHDAVRLANELAQPFSLAIALGQRAFVHQFRGEPRRVEQEAEATTAVAVEHGLPLYLVAGTMLRGWATAAQGSTQEGLAAVRRALTDLRGTGADSNRSYYLALLAELCGRAKQWDDGLRALAEAFAIIEEKGGRWWEAELHRLQGELLLGRSNEVASAEACFRRALEVARGQGAKAFELRAAIGLARLWRDHGRRAEAHDLLAPVYGWFTEGFTTADLMEAKTLLDQLGWATEALTPSSLGVGPGWPARGDGR